MGQERAFGTSRHLDFSGHGEAEGTRGMANAPKFLQLMGASGLHWAIEMCGASFPDISKILRPLVGQERAFGSSRHFDFGGHGEAERTRGMANAPKFLQHIGELGLHWAIEMCGASFPEISKILRPLVGQKNAFGSSRHFDFSGNREAEEPEGWPMHTNFCNSWGSWASIGPLKCVEHLSLTSARF